MRLPKISLEEHVVVPDAGESGHQERAYFDGQKGGLFGARPWLRNALLDIHGQLLQSMDAAGIEMSVLSLNAVGIQGIPDKAEAIATARRANDYLAEQVAKNPKRFQAFAALPMQDPEAAAQELTRSVRSLGLKGTLVNGFSQIGREDNAVYLDLPQYWDFWATVESLDVPFCLHPRDPLPGWTPFLDGHPWLLNARWAFTVETASHALRLMASGLFDRYPKLTIVLGHLGETLPNAMWRIDNRIERMPSREIPAKQKLGHYLRNNFYICTSGNFCTAALMNTVQCVGADRILFAVDYPFSKMTEASAWFDALDVISESDWNKIARTNAEKLLKLDCSKSHGVSA